MLNENAFKLHLEQLLAGNVKHPAPVAFHSVECGNGNHVVIIRIPQSWQAPHRVNEDNKFFAQLFLWQISARRK